MRRRVDLDTMLRHPDWVSDLSHRQTWHILLQAFWRMAVLEARILRIRIVLCWLYILQALGCK